MKYFKMSEFTCKCGCGSCNMNEKFLRMIDKAREYAKTPFKITSGYRCPTHNTNVGGTKTSSHQYGYAADIKYSTELQLVHIIFGLTKAGFCRIGINADKKFIHVDNDPNKPDAIFTY